VWSQRPLGCRHLDSLFAGGRDVPGLAPGGSGRYQADCRSVAHRNGVNEILWRRQLKTIGEQGKRPLGTEAAMLGQDSSHRICVGIDPVVWHAVTGQESARGQHRRRGARADH
jgi:hypothetical protein